MSKPRWWKNAVKIIKSLTTKTSHATFELDDTAGIVIFHYHVYIDNFGMVEFEESVTLDALNSILVEQVLASLLESLRLRIYEFLREKGRGLDHPL